MTQRTFRKRVSCPNSWASGFFCVCMLLCHLRFGRERGLQSKKNQKGPECLRDSGFLPSREDQMLLCFCCLNLFGDLSRPPLPCVPATAPNPSSCFTSQAFAHGLYSTQDVLPLFVHLTQLCTSSLSLTTLLRSNLRTVKFTSLSVQFNEL